MTGRLNKLLPSFALLRLAAIPLVALLTLLVSSDGVRAAGTFNPANTSVYCKDGTGAIDQHTEFHPKDWRGGQAGQVSYYDRLFKPGKLERSLAVVEGLRATMREQLRARIGVHPVVELVPPGTLARSEFKARRVIDDRDLYRQTLSGQKR